MKVSLLNDSFPPVIDGVVNVVMNYAKIMTQELGAQVQVGTPRYPDADYSGYPYPVIPYQSFDTTGIVSGYRAGNPFEAKAIREMADFAPDIIHTHCPVSSTIMARILRNETDAPVVFTYHTKFDVDIARAVKAKFLQKESIKTLVDNISSCDEIWVVSRGAGENLRSLGYEGNFKVMPNGVDFAKGCVDSETVRKVTAGYDLPEHIPVFLFVGRMMKYKGLPMILDAMKILKERKMDYRMVFVGDGADLEEMREKAEKDGISDRTIFAGAERDRDRLRAWNTRADLFLFPSTYDTNGIVVREAAACGLASVLIRDSCASEGITDGRNGYLIEETPQAMASLLFEICRDMEHVHQVGQKAMDEIYISWESAVRLAYNRYEEILELKREGYLRGRKYQTSDYFLSTGAGLVGRTRQIFSSPKKIYGGMLENVTEFWGDLQDAADYVTTGIRKTRDGISEILRDTKEDFLGMVRDSRAELSESVGESIREEGTDTSGNDENKEE